MHLYKSPAISELKIENKKMIRNQYNYLTSTGQDTSGKEGRTKSNDTTIKTSQAES